MKHIAGVHWSRLSGSVEIWSRWRARDEAYTLCKTLKAEYDPYDIIYEMRRKKHINDIINLNIKYVITFFNY